MPLADRATLHIGPDGTCPRCLTTHAFAVVQPALSDTVWCRNHWAEPDPYNWLREALGRADELPDGPILVLGAAACGEVRALPRDRDVVCLDAERAGLQHALALQSAGNPALSRVQFTCASALDPPFEPASFALVVCCNLVDSVSDPEVLLNQCEALLVTGGALLLSTPYQFREEVTPRDRWLPELLGNPDDLEDAFERLVTGAWDGAFMASMRLQWSARKVPWAVEVNARMTALYQMHVLLLRRASADGLPVASATVPGRAKSAD